MTDKSELPEYSASLIALVTFVRDIAKDDTLQDHGLGSYQQQAQDVLSNFILASLFRLADNHTSQKKETLDELERKNPDGFRNPVDRWHVVEISTGDYLQGPFNTEYGALNYCAELNNVAGGRKYRVVAE